MLRSIKLSSKTAVVAISAMVATLIPGATLSPAHAAPVTKFDNANIYRAITNNEFTLRANETLNASVSANVDSFTSDGVKQISSDFAVTPNIPGVTYGSKGYNWSFSGCNTTPMTASATPCSDATRVSYYMYQTLTNTTSSPITISTNISSAQLTYGSTAITISGKYVSASRNVNSSAPEMTTGLVITSDDQRFYASTTLCLNRDLVSVGDVLSWQESASIASNSISDTYHMSDPYITFTANGNPLSDVTLSAPLPTQFNLSVNGYNLSAAPGTLAVSVDLQKNGSSVLQACPDNGNNNGGYTPPPPLFSLGGATVSGTFSVGSAITATPNTWSRTNGGASQSVTTEYDWLVCSQAQPTGTTSPANVPCIMGDSLDFVLADGNSIGDGMSGPVEFFSGPRLTITQNLLTALTGKYLLVVVSGTASGPTARSNVFMPTCGPISSGATCSVAFGTAPPVVTPTAKPAQKLAKAIPTKAKAGKPITIGAVSKSKVALKVKVAGKGCKVAPVKDKKKKIVSYKITMGKKGVTCTVTVTAPATSSVAALKSVTKIKAS